MERYPFKVQGFIEASDVDRGMDLLHHLLSASDKIVVKRTEVGELAESKPDLIWCCLCGKLLDSYDFKTKSPREQFYRCEKCREL